MILLHPILRPRLCVKERPLQPDAVAPGFMLLSLIESGDGT